MSEENSKERSSPRLGGFSRFYAKKYGQFVSSRAELTPEQLFEMAVRYFEWAETNSIKAIETASFQGVVYQNPVNKWRVFTIDGFCLFACISHVTLQNYRKKEHYAEVMEFIDTVIREQKYQLAMNNLVNANMVAKDLGIGSDSSINVEVNAQASADINAVSVDDVKDAVKDIMGLLE